MAGAGVGYLLHVLLARWMGEASYGSYVYAVSWAVLLASFGGLGLYTAVLRFVPQYREARQPGLLKGFLQHSRQIVFAATVGLALLATLILWLLPASAYTAYGPALAAGFWAAPLLALSRWGTETLRARKRIGWAYGTMRVLRPALVIAGASLLTLLSASLSALRVVGVYALALALVVGVQWLLVRRAFAAETPPVRPRHATRQWLGVALPLLLVTGALLLRAKTDLLLIGLLMAPEKVGIYNAALQTAYAALYVSAGVDAVAAPGIASAHARDEPGALPKLARRLAHWYFWPTLLAAALVASFAGPVLSLFGPAFSEGRGVVLVLLGALVVNAGAGPVKHLLHLTGHERRSVHVLLWTLALNAVLNLIGIHFFGLLGAALATALSLIARDLWLCALVRRHLGLHPSIVGALRAAHERSRPA